MKANYAFIAHLRVYQQSLVGITLFVSKQGFLGPHQQTGSKWIPTFEPVLNFADIDYQYVTSGNLMR